MLAPRKKLWSTPDSALDQIILPKWIPSLNDDDCVCDVGCGDGRIVLKWAEHHSNEMEQRRQNGEDEKKTKKSDDGNESETRSARFVGIDIDDDRIGQCQASLEDARSAGRIRQDVNVNFVAANALGDEAKEIYERSTILFLYLIPRGLKMILPILESVAEEKRKTRRRRRRMANDDPSPNDEDEAKQTTDQVQDDFESGPALRVITYMSPLPGVKALDRGRCKVPHQPDAEWPLYLYHL